MGPEELGMQIRYVTTFSGAGAEAAYNMDKQLRASIERSTSTWQQQAVVVKDSARVQADAIAKVALSAKEKATVAVDSAIKEKAAWRELAAEYTAMARTAQRGSATQVESYRLAADAAVKAGIKIRDAHLIAAGGVARAERTGGREARGLLSGTGGLGGRAVAFGSTAFLGGALLGAGVKGIMDTSKSMQVAEAQLRAALAASNISWAQNGAAIGRNLVATSKYSGYLRGELTTSYTTLLRTTGSVTAAQHAQSAAINLARGRNLDLQQATKMVMLAQEGHVGLLRRVGINLNVVTTAEDALRAAHVHATPEVMKAAKAYDLQRTGIGAVDAIARKYAGSAAAYNKTAAGATARYQAAVEELQVSLGKVLLPVLATAVTAITKWVEKITASGSAQRNLNALLGLGKTAFTVIHDVIKAADSVTGGFSNTVATLFAIMAINKMRAIGTTIAEYVVKRGIVVLGTSAVVAEGEVVASATAMSFSFTALKGVIIGLIGSTGIGLLVVGFALAATYVITHWAKVKRWFSDFTGWITDVFDQVVRGVERAFGKLVQFIGSILAQIPSWMPGLGKFHDWGVQMQAWGKGLGYQVGQGFGDAVGNAAAAAMSKVTKGAAAGYQPGTYGMAPSTRQNPGGYLPAAPSGFIPGTQGSVPSTKANPTGSTAYNASAGRKKMLDLAATAIGTPYVWGGNAPGGFDCSGLVQWAMANGLDIKLPHSTYSQVTMGRQVTLANAKPGDIVFTGYGEGGKAGPGHEGIYLGGGQVLSAPHTGARVGTSSLAGFTGGGAYTIRDLIGGGGGGGTGTGGDTGALPASVLAAAAAARAAAAKKAADKAAKAASAAVRKYVSNLNKQASDIMRVAAASFALDHDIPALQAATAQAVGDYTQAATYAAAHGAPALASTERADAKTLRARITKLVAARVAAVRAAVVKAATAAINVQVGLLEGQATTAGNIVGTMQATLAAAGVDAGGAGGLGLEQAASEQAATLLGAVRVGLLKQLRRAQQQGLSKLVASLTTKLAAVTQNMNDAVLAAAGYAQQAVAVAAQNALSSAQHMVTMAQGGASLLQLQQQQANVGLLDAGGQPIGFTGAQLQAQAAQLTGTQVPAQQALYHQLQQQLATAQAGANITTVTPGVDVGGGDWVSRAVRNMGTTTSTTHVVDQNLVNSILEQMQQVQQDIGAANVQAAQLIAQAAQASRQAAADAASAVVQHAGHIGNMAQLGYQTLQLNEQLSSTFGTPAAAVEQQAYIRAQILPALQGELAALQQQLVVAQGNGDMTLAEQIAEAIAGKQNDILQQSLDAQKLTADATQTLADTATQGSLGFGFGGESWTDTLLGAGVGA